MAGPAGVAGFFGVYRPGAGQTAFVIATAHVRYTHDPQVSHVKLLERLGPWSNSKSTPIGKRLSWDTPPGQCHGQARYARRSAWFGCDRSSVRRISH